MSHERKASYDVTSLDKGETLYLKDDAVFGHVQKSLNMGGEHPSDHAEQMGGNLELSIGMYYEDTGRHPTVPARVYHAGNITVLATIQRGAAPENARLFVDVRGNSIRELYALMEDVHNYFEDAVKRESAKATVQVS